MAVTRNSRRAMIQRRWGIFIGIRRLARRGRGGAGLHSTDGTPGRCRARHRPGVPSVEWRPAPPRPRRASLRIPMKIPHLRWIIALLLFLVTAINYADRLALSVVSSELRKQFDMTE